MAFDVDDFFGPTHYRMRDDGSARLVSVSCSRERISFMATGLSPVLREIHRLRKHIKSLQGEIERGPRTLKAHQTKLTSEEQAFKDAQDALKKLKVQLHEHEVTLKVTSAQLTKFEGQLDSMGNPKEFNSKQSEITHAKAKIAELEDTIFAKIALMEEQTTALPITEAKVHEARQKFATFEIESKARHTRLMGEIQTAEGELKVAEASLPEEIRPLVARAVAAYGVDALAAIRDRACNYCHTALTGQQRMDLDAGRFLTCKSCARVNYLDE